MMEFSPDVNDSATRDVASVLCNPELVWDVEVQDRSAAIADAREPP